MATVCYPDNPQPALSISLVSRICGIFGTLSYIPLCFMVTNRPNLMIHHCESEFYTLFIY